VGPRRARLGVADRRGTGADDGRTKADSIELDDKPPDSHVASTDQDTFGKIFRRNMPFGTVTDHGTMFVGFSARQEPLATMLESMAGLASGTRDALTRYTKPVTGAYYVVPSTQALRRIVDAAGALSPTTSSG
jgi:putative iron-dependent peroxidase